MKQIMLSEAGIFWGFPILLRQSDSFTVEIEFDSRLKTFVSEKLWHKEQVRKAAQKILEC